MQKKLKALSGKRLIVWSLIVLFVHFGAHFIGSAILELYHLTQSEKLYEVYGKARFIANQFVFWKYRWVVTFLVGIIAYFILLWRQTRASTHKNKRAVHGH